MTKITFWGQKNHFWCRKFTIFGATKRFLGTKFFNTLKDFNPSNVLTFAAFYDFLVGDIANTNTLSLLLKHLFIFIIRTALSRNIN